ncbi:hypothetical protein P43SY_007849 [Pythium insidiosum]|uniref:ATPase AAA-type core domain-containing protein n=1 Tax=Pythium insidiosum TaxID=114742 RepID=A0AAD5LIS9_PYTIN|nr:hypothetical protein P43SY_007849 [Pythium insidiosum]
MAGTRSRRRLRGDDDAAASVSVLDGHCDTDALALLRGSDGAAMSAAADEELEEIDTDEDDHEFDERAHWGRRGRRNRRRNKQDKSQPTIDAFCVAVAPVDTSTPPPEEPRSELPVEAPPGVETAVEDAAPVVAQREDTTQPVDEASTTTMATTTTVTMARRSKRQAALQQENLAAKKCKQDDAVEDTFMTPPPTKPVRKAGADRATLDGEPERKVQSSGRKRKLEMAGAGKKQSTAVAPAVAPAAASPDTARARPASVFFLTAEQKRQVIEIEAVETFKEQLRQQRERDLAFFGGREIKNAFFQARIAEKKVIDVDADTEIIEIADDDGCTTPSPERVSSQGKKRWSKDLVVFPKLQHVLAEPPTEPFVPPPTLSLARRRPVSDPEAVVVIDDEDEEEHASCGRGRPSWWGLDSSPNAVDTERVASDSFWLLTQQPDSLIIDFDTPRDAVAERVAEAFGVKEKRIGKTLHALEQAKGKREEKKANLALVDRYLPMEPHGLVGNKEALRFLSSWLLAWKQGRDERQRRSCFESEMFVFEDDESEFSSAEDTDLCRLFLLEGGVGSGKSAAVYACAEELGFQIIEINASQQRTGKQIAEIVGEATQSTRVLHCGNASTKKKKNGETKKSPRQKKARRDSREADGTRKRAHLSLVLFEDIDLVFEEDKGFLSTMCAIAKHAKCPIVATPPDSMDRRFSTDYLPMLAEIIQLNNPQQESRRRSSRRNHYLRDVLSDMTLLEEIPRLQAFAASGGINSDGANDEIVASSPPTPSFLI